MPVVLLLSLALLIVVQGGLGIMQHPGEGRLLGKSVATLMVTVVLVYVWTHRTILNGELIFRLALAGVGMGLLVTVLKIISLYLMGVGTRYDISALTSFLYIHDAVNNELKIISVLVFGAVLGIAAHKERHVALLTVISFIMLVSYFSAGFKDMDGAAVIVEGVYSETVQFGLPLAFIMLVLARIASGLMTNLLFLGLGFVLFNSPWLFQVWFYLVQLVPLPRAENILQRAEIWDAVGRKIMEAPFWGHGIDSARYQLHFDFANDFAVREAIWHPHNMFLQLWLDLGVAGVAIVLGLFYFSWRYVLALEPLSRPAVLAGIVMLAVVTLVSHSLWQTWSFALIAFFVVLVSLQPPALFVKRES